MGWNKWLWRNELLKMGIARVLRGRDINSINSGQLDTYFIPLFHRYCAYLFPSYVYRIGEVAAEQSAIEDRHPPGTKSEGYQLWQYCLDRDILYTII